LIMLQNHATLSEARSYLKKEISGLYPETEVSSMISIILEHLGFPYPNPFSAPERQSGNAVVAQINEIVNEIHSHRPLQYILGYTTFCELKIKVNEKVLIPRPETEEMVLRIVNGQKDTPRSILDLGTGSGCIALALKKHFPGASVLGLELREEALEMARGNGSENNLKVEWILGDMLAGNLPDRFEEFDLVVSNPPYVLESERNQMDRNVLDYEPADALFVEDRDPFVFCRAVAAACEKLLKRGGELWLEINERFGSESRQIIRHAGFAEVNLYQDIHGKDRFIEARK
jgi:release factor glutamine methyltransferase